ncbi:MAG: hypothetical protein MK108_16265 [Mariniblastus sp.]|nr:hypothetical protein [Mariniblastus sp.]
MANLIPLEQAAKMLGISVEKLTEMRSSQQVSAYKDGATWKFKLQELERVADDLGTPLNQDVDDDSDFQLSDASLEDSADAASDDEGLAFGSSSLDLAAGDDAEVSADLLDDDEKKSDGSPSDTGKLMAGDDDDMLLSEEDLFGDDSLADSYEESAELSSDFEDSDLILDDSDSSSEVAMESGQSGASLSTNESGVSLDDEPLELGGAEIDSLELPEDDEMIVLDDAADSDAATIMQEDDFNLTPLEEAVDDDSSGSQIIALEDSEIYTDESSATILADSEDLSAEPAMLDASAFGAADAGNAGLVPAGVGAPVMAGAPALPEAPYTLWQILALALVVIMLGAGAMVAYDLARAINQPEGQMIGSGAVLDFFLKMTGMN